MVPTKENDKGSHKEMTCRYCKATNETQPHIIEECPKMHTITKGNLKYDEIFNNNNIERLREVADIKYK